MKSLSMIAVAVVIGGLASACSVRTETVEKPVPASTATVTTAPAPATVVYSDPPPPTTVYVNR